MQKDTFSHKEGTVVFENFNETNDGAKVNLLRSQLAIVDRYSTLSMVAGGFFSSVCCFWLMF
jgi:hypothetical protein